MLSVYRLSYLYILSIYLLPILSLSLSTDPLGSRRTGVQKDGTRRLGRVGSTVRILIFVEVLLRYASVVD